MCKLCFFEPKRQIFKLTTVAQQKPRPICFGNKYSRNSTRQWPFPFHPRSVSIKEKNKKKGKNHVLPGKKVCRAAILAAFQCCSTPCTACMGYSEIQPYYNISVFWIYFTHKITCSPRIYLFGFLQINTHEYLQSWAKISNPIPTSKANEWIVYL